MKGLLFITHQTNRYTYLQSVEIALEGGCRQIQLRMKGVSVAEVTNTALQAKQLCDGYGASLFINDYPEVCKNVKATGVHLGKQDIEPAVAGNLLGDSYIIGGTANTFDDICRLAQQGVNYIGLGPYRFTTTKKNLSPVLGLEVYRHILDCCKKKGISLPILAIGGITLADIPPLLSVGVSGIALSSTILAASDPIDETKKIINLINNYTL